MTIAIKNAHSTKAIKLSVLNSRFGERCRIVCCFKSDSFRETQLGDCKNA